MIKLDMIGNNENNDDFHFKEYFHQLVTVNNQDIFNVEEKIETRFFIDYTKYIIANFAS